MGALLACCRRCGMPWSDRSFGRLAVLAVRDLGTHERENWMAVFTEQRTMWHAAYTCQLVVRHNLDVR